MGTNATWNDSKYKDREKSLERIYKPDSIYASKVVASIVVLVCILADFYIHFVKWNVVQTEDAWYVALTALVCAIALDVPLAIAGEVLKQFDQGLCSKRQKNLIMIMAIAVFTITYIFSFGFTVATREFLFEVGSASTMTNTVGSTVETAEETEPHMAVIVAALYNAVLPLLTSLASFICSYYASNPLKEKMYRNEKEKIYYQERLKQVDKAIMKADTSYFEELLASEKDKYAEMKQSLNADNLYMKEMVRMVLAEKMKTPEENDSIGRNGKAMIRAYDANEQKAKKFLPDFIAKYIKKREEEDYE